CSVMSASKVPPLSTGAAGAAFWGLCCDGAPASALIFASSSAAIFAAASRSISLGGADLEDPEETLLRSIPFSSFGWLRLPKAIRLISVGQIKPMTTKLPAVHRPIAQAGSRHQA